jgi:hypothetical protein
MVWLPSRCHFDMVVFITISRTSIKEKMENVSVESIDKQNNTKLGDPQFITKIDKHTFHFYLIFQLIIFGT